MTFPTTSETTTITPPFPIFKGAVYNTNVNNNTNIFASDLTPTYTPTVFTVYYTGNSTTGTFTDARYPSIKRTNGTNTNVENIGFQFSNEVPGVYQFIVGPNDSINFVDNGGNGTHISAMIVSETGLGSSLISPGQEL